MKFPVRPGNWDDKEAMEIYYAGVRAFMRQPCEEDDDYAEKTAPAVAVTVPAVTPLTPPTTVTSPTIIKMEAMSEKLEALELKIAAESELLATYNLTPVQKMERQRQQRLLAMEERDREEQLAKQKAKDEAFSCRRCAAKFPSNSKLHKHVAERHTKKASLSPVEPPTVKLPTAPLPTPPASTPSTTPKLSYAAVAKSANSAKASLPTPPTSPQPKISYAKLAESTSTTTTSSRPPPIPWHTKPKACTKPRNYMTMEDLFRRFSPTNHQPTKAAEPKTARPKRSGCKSKTPVLIKSTKPRKVAPPTKVATPKATFRQPPSTYYQQVKHAVHIRPSGNSIYQHQAATHICHIWQYTRDLGLRLIKLSY